MPILDPEFQAWLHTSYVPIMGGAPGEGEVEPEAEDTPPADSDEGTPAPDESEHSDEDWESRYKEVQGSYTQSQQELAEYRDFMEKLQSDEETQRQVFAELGLDSPNKEDEGEYVDPGEQALQQIKEMQAERETEKQQTAAGEAEKEQLDNFLGKLDKFEEDNDLELSDEEVEFLVARVLFEKAKPEDVFKAWQNVDKQRHERVVASKKAPRAPKGQAGSPEFDPSNQEQVDAAVLQEVEAAMAESE